MKNSAHTSWSRFDTLSLLTEVSRDLTQLRMQIASEKFFGLSEKSLRAVSKYTH